MPKSKSRKNKSIRKSKTASNHSASQKHADWHVTRQQSSTGSYVPNMRTKQNANWEKRS